MARGKAKSRPVTAPTASDAPPSRAPLVAAVAVLALAAVLIFAGLGSRILWVDEAETALLGRSILHHGVPRALDGKNLISQEAGREYDANFVWRWTPWLDKYVAAASFLVLGEGTVPARLPFALVGLAAVASMYPLARSLFRDRRVAPAAMAFLALSVPFLLHVRQCRYYALAILGFLWAVYFVAATVRGERGAVPGLVAALTVVFHSNYLSFVASATSLAVAVWFLPVDRRAVRRLALAGALLAAVNGPWMAYFNVLGKAEETGRISSFSSNLAIYLGLAALHVFPVAALLPAGALAAWARRRRPLLERGEGASLRYLAAAPVVYLVAIAAGPWVFFRYAVNVLPVAALLLAWLSVRAFDWHRVLGGVFAACLLLTGVFHRVSAPRVGSAAAFLSQKGRSFPAFDWAFPLGNYLYEVTHPFQDATEAIVGYLKVNARPGDRVFITYGDLVLRFYLDLDVRGGQSGESLVDWPAPEWVVVRRFFRFGDRPHLKADADRMKAWLDRDVPWNRYREILLAPPDFPWEGIPEPHLHWFRAPTRGERVRLFRLTNPGP